MKIYEIGTGYTPIPAKVAAATESVVEELTKAFLKSGQDVSIVDIATDCRQENSLPIIEVAVPSLFAREDVSLGIAHKLKRVVYSVFLAKKLKGLIKAEKDNIVLHFHNQYNLFFFNKLVSKKLRSRAVIAYTNHNGFWSLPWETARATLQKRYFQEISAMKEADLIFPLNDAMRENIIEQLGIEAERVVKVSNGVNVDVYKPLPNEKIAAVKEKFSLGGKKIILQVGSINENKGQARAIKLLAPFLKSNSDFVYAYVGGVVSAEYHELVKQTARELEVSDSVIYLGAVSPGEEMNELYNVAVATIFLSEYEGFPLVCIESLAASVPVILCSERLADFGKGCFNADSDSISEVIEGIDCNSASVKADARNTAVSSYIWEKIAGDYRVGFERTLNCEK